MNIKGQSLIESIILIPLFIAFWAALVWFAQACIVSIELLHTARHGVFWLAYNDDRRMNSSDETQRTKSECLAFLHQQAPGLDANRVHITVTPGDRWQPVGPKTLVDMMGILRLVTHLTRSMKEAAGLIQFQPASVQVEYDLPIPSILRIIPGFPSRIPLRGHCVCYR